MPASAAAEKISPAEQFVLTYTEELETAAQLLLLEGSVVHASVFQKIASVFTASSRAEFIRRAYAALSWLVRRLPETDAAEFVLGALREITTTPEAAAVLAS